MNRGLFLIGLVCGIVGIAVGTIDLVAATSESEGSFKDLDCQEGYELDSSGSACIPTKNENNNETGITPEEEFGLTMRLVETAPIVCLADNMTDIVREACIVQGYLKGDNTSSNDNDDEED